MCCATDWQEPAPDEQDYQAVFAYQGAMAYVYLADRSTCAAAGQQCDWNKPPRFGAEVMPAVRAFDYVNRTGTPIPRLKGIQDLIFARERTPAGQHPPRPFEIFDGKKLVPIYAYLKAHPRPDLLQLNERMRWVGVGPYGNRAGDIVLLARSGLTIPIEQRYYFSGPYRSWHGSPSAGQPHSARARLPGQRWQGPAGPGRASGGESAFTAGCDSAGARDFGQVGARAATRATTPAEQGGPAAGCPRLWRRQGAG